MKSKKRKIDFSYLIGDHESYSVGGLENSRDENLYEMDRKGYLKKQLVKVIENHEMKTVVF